jgi:hypothetical protein
MRSLTLRSRPRARARARPREAAFLNEILRYLLDEEKVTESICYENQIMLVLENHYFWRDSVVFFRGRKR